MTTKYEVLIQNPAERILRSDVRVYNVALPHGNDDVVQYGIFKMVEESRDEAERRALFAENQLEMEQAQHIATQAERDGLRARALAAEEALAQAQPFHDSFCSVHNEPAPTECPACLAVKQDDDLKKAQAQVEEMRVENQWLLEDSVLLDAQEREKWAVEWNSRIGQWTVQHSAQTVGCIAKADNPRAAIRKAIDAALALTPEGGAKL